MQAFLRFLRINFSHLPSGGTVRNVQAIDYADYHLYNCKDDLVPKLFNAFNNKTIWVTGASSGIGEHLCYALDKAGARLIMSARRESELERVRLACNHSDKHLICIMDMQDVDSIKPIVNDVLSKVGDIDILINNAGITQRGRVEDLDFSVYRRVLEVNYFAKVALTQALLPHMQQRQSGQIVAISSIAGLVGVAYRSAYSSSKAAIIGFMDALRAEVSDQGISVTTICPGFVQTNIVDTAKREGTAKADADDSMITGGMSADDAVEKILLAIAKKQPQVNVATGAERFAPYIQRYFPRLMYRIMFKARIKP